MRRAILTIMLATASSLYASASGAEESAPASAPFAVAILVSSPAAAAPVAHTRRDSGLFSQDDVDDPAGLIAPALARSVATALDAQAADASIAVGDEKPAEIAALAAPARYVVDVKTMGWSYRHKSLGGASYDVRYRSRFRLIDTQSKAVVAESNCRWRSGRSRAGSQSAGDSAEGLQVPLDMAAASCAEQFAEALRGQEGFGSRVSAPRLVLQSQSTLSPSQSMPERFGGYRLR